MIETGAALPAEALIRLSAFLGMLIIMWGWESLRPLRRGSGAGRRWVNLALVGVDTVCLRLTLPLLAVGVAALAAERDIGLLNQLAWPAWLEIIVSLLVLDLAIYGQHRAFHRIPLLWRVHAMHHSDTAFDTTTGLRFHPIEIVLSMLFKMLVVGLLGAPVIAVVVFEIALNAASLFNHGNVALPVVVERPLRWLLVTPALHRIHHSIDSDEHHRNFGFTLSLWDRLLGSYRDRPERREDEMPFGLRRFRGATDQGLGALLWQPFVSRRRD